MALRVNGPAHDQPEEARELLSTGDGWCFWASGGGCESLRLDQNLDGTGFFSQVTDMDGVAVPEFMDEPCMCGIYDPDGQCVQEPDLTFTGTAKACMAEADALLAIVRSTFSTAGDEGVRDFLRAALVQRGWHRITDEA